MVSIQLSVWAIVISVLLMKKTKVFLSYYSFTKLVNIYIFVFILILRLVFFC